MIIVDTNVWSETTKRAPDPRVVSWLRRNDTQTVLSVIVWAELSQGISLTSGPADRSRLRAWLDELVAAHVGRQLVFDGRSAEAWGALTARSKLAGTTLPAQDAFIAAQAVAHGLPVATRNLRDFDIPGITIIDPWQP